MKNRIQTAQQGFSLVEWLMVIALIGVIGSIGTQSWNHYQQREKLLITARQLLIFLTHVQTDAFWLNRSALLWQSHSEHWCIGSGIQPTNGCSQQDGWLFSPEYPDITLAEYMPENMGFYGLRNTAQPGHITLANSAGRIRLVISNQGRMRLCSEQHSQGRIPLCH
ncbi:prepilin peptidase-dependent protein [Yersinia ruckeri]|uniref:Prepilin peptidase dependent protein A n=2 Tax=Gammaproteobacteria TaxID=1236 RepID=A0A0A5HBC2_YERRU|nr:prepilin peptidase-dependent protein [Yersinia ruckeri]AKA38139.1 N-terminal cleavage protein [Yersinia ruckeri]AUQ42127.1 prepilin-type cleavage/methylation domain-containing protein [Yersinia ruckeri]EEP99361.1 Prepilin-type N-terminal cleavage/methylation domain protein [Yersinia ruckeri ATCC 29473]EKN3346974.1 prepilin peptidase-dependent protein [Yersinia ruckeri]EKN3362417.1 prepilin peptidase-dependent protein [Yersinia ruckeri]